MGDMDMLRGAQWLSGPDFDYGVDSAGYYEPVHRTHVVSRSFRLTAEEAEGLQLTIAVLGYAKLHVNGEPLPRVELLGHWTRWDRAVYTDTFDVTGLVRAGENRISIELGNGFYNPSPLTLFGKYNLRDRLAEVGTPQVLCALHAGGAPVLVSDASWACAEGELLFNNVYLGEVRDLRPAHAGAPLDLVARANDRTILPNPAPLCVDAGSVEAIAVRDEGDRVIIDFGEVVAGFIDLAFDAADGDELVLRYAEGEHEGMLSFESNVAGHVGRTTPRGTCPGGAAWDRAMAKGGAQIPMAEERDVAMCREGGNSLRNTFTCHSFRFVEIRGLRGGAAAISSARAVYVHNDIPELGTFACDSAPYMDLYDAARRTKLNNMHDVFEDCARERFGYGGDMVALSDSNFFMFDMAGMLDKTLADFRRDQTDRGGLPETAPFVGIGSNGPAYGEGPLLWQLAYPYLAVALDRYQGCPEILRREWPAIERFGDYLLSFDPAELAPHCLGDHGSVLTGDNFKSGTPDKEFVGWCAIAWCLGAVAEAGRRCGRDASRFDLAAAALLPRIKGRFWREDGLFGDGTQTGLAFAAALGLGDPEVLAERLAEDIKGKGNLITCGIFGIMLTYKLLARYGHHDVVERWLMREESPSFRSMMATGNRALAEEFDSPLASLDHAMFSSYAQWFFEGLAGIQVAPDARACSEVRIRPYLSPTCRWVRCSHQTPHGELLVAWEHREGAVEVVIEVPRGVSAQIEMEGGSLALREDLPHGDRFVYIVEEAA